MTARIDLAGRMFGRLTVLEIAEGITDGGHNLYWRCRCVCGAEKPISSYNLRSGAIRSCGCLRREQGWRELSAAKAHLAREVRHCREQAPQTLPFKNGDLKW